MLANQIAALFPGIRIGPGDDGDECVLSESGIAKWNRPEKQPTPQELQAAEPAAVAALQAKATEKQDADTARTDAKQAFGELEPLRSHKDPAIALLAGIMQNHILATLGR